MKEKESSIDPQELLVHLDWVRSLARSLAADPSRAEDVEQETWLYALARPPRHGANLRGWLGSVVRNMARQIGRSERARSERERRVARRESTLDADLVADACLHREVVDRVLALGEAYRSVLLLRYFHGRGPREIADELGLPLNTVRSRLSRGLARLRTELDREHGRERWTRVLVAPVPWVSAALRAGIGLVAASLVAALSWTVASTERSTGIGEPSRPGPTATTAASSPIEALVAPGRAPAAQVATGGPGPLAEDRGVLRLRVVDGRTEAPLADLEFAVFVERGGDRLLAAGRTDAAGRATVTGLPENTVLVQTARRPPSAAGFRAVWLPAGGEREVVVRAGRGGTLAGRVVDERGVPVAGLRVLAKAHLVTDGPTFQKSSARYEEVGLTDAEGRFRVGHLTSLPRGVWVVDGEERPERWEDASLHVQDPEFDTWEQLEVRGGLGEGDELELGELVLPRPIRYAGRVTDGRGQPLADALVSAFPDRRRRVGMGLGTSVLPESLGRPPWHPAFELFPGEARTDPAGRFELRCPGVGRTDTRLAFVWTPSGQTEDVRLPAAAPGDFLRGVELAIAEADVLSIVLQRLDGSPVGRLAGDPRVRGTGAYAFLDPFGHVATELVFADGRVQQVRDGPHADGVLRLQLEAPAAELRSLELRAPGHLEARHELPDGLVTSRPHPVRLTPKPTVRVSITHAVEDLGHTPLNARVHACLLAPEERARRGMDWSACCGLGAVATVPLGTAPADVDLPVSVARPFWVYTAGRNGSFAIEECAHGPFAPGEPRRGIAVTVRPLEGSGEERPPPAALTPRPGEAHTERLEELGYAQRIEPDRGPAAAVRLVEADGVPLAAGTRVRVEGPPPTVPRVTTVGDDGRVEISLDRAPGPGSSLPPLTLTIDNARRPGRLLTGSQRVVVDGWSVEQVVTATLAPYRTVEVLVRGFDPELRDASLFVGLGFGADDDRVARALEVPAQRSDQRRYRLLLGPGTYEVVAQGWLYSAEPTSVTVTSHEEHQRFIVDVR